MTITNDVMEYLQSKNHLRGKTLPWGTGLLIATRA